jgi:hypothetical protein
MILICMMITWPLPLPDLMFHLSISSSARVKPDFILKDVCSENKCTARWCSLQGPKTSPAYFFSFELNLSLLEYQATISDLFLHLDVCTLYHFESHAMGCHSQRFRQPDNQQHLCPNRQDLDWPITLSWVESVQSGDGKLLVPGND